MTKTTTTTPTTTPAPADAASTDLVRQQQALDKLAKSAEKDSLDDLLRGDRRSLLLVDVSGSMRDRIKAGGRKIDALRRVVEMLQQTHAVPVVAFGLAGELQVDVVDSVPEPAGMTPLHLAIDFGREQGATHLVVVTDGIPDSQSAAFAAADRFARPIDVFYIGDGNDDGAKFTRELARRTGGKSDVTDLGQPKQLAAGIRALLGDGTL